MIPAGRAGHPSVPLPFSLAAAGFIWLSAAAGLAQTGPPPGLTVPGAQPGPPVETVIDTATAVLDITGLDMAPVRVHAVQDTVVFGELFHLVLDFPAEAPPQPDIPLAAGEEWLVPEILPEPGFWDRLLGRAAPVEPEVQDLPETAAGTRLVLPFRVYRTDPFLVRAGDSVTGVVQVAGRVDGTADTAPIRSPRPVPWSPWIVLGLLAFLALVLFVARLLWKRGKGPDAWRDREIPAPAWLGAAIELRDLLARGYLNRGESRPFLDGLAAISRRYAAGRYRIAAQEMTGREITAACRGLGFLSPHPGVFARLIDAVDRHRYNPEPAPPGWCRDQAIVLYREMGRVRVLPRYTEVPADLIVESEIAWKDLGRELAAGSDRPALAGSGHPGGEA